MNDLDTLRPEVTVLGPCKMCGATGYSLSYGGAYICPACDCGINPEITRLNRELQEARAELLRLATIEADALIALDCEHDWQVEHKRAEKAEAELVAALKANRDCVDHFEQMQDELAALKARIANLPVEWRDDGKWHVSDHTCVVVEE